MAKTLKKKSKMEEFDLSYPDQAYLESCAPYYECEECSGCLCANCLRRDTSANRQLLAAKELGCIPCTACFEAGGRIPTDECLEHVNKKDDINYACN